MLFFRPPLPRGPPPLPPSQPLFPSGAQPPPPGPSRPPLPPGGPTDGSPRPAFPAYQNSEAPPPGPPRPEAPAKTATKVPPVGAGCKLVHPEEDLSMVSRLGYMCVCVLGVLFICFSLHICQCRKSCVAECPSIRMLV